MHTSRSPESAPSTLACAVSSTELSGTASLFVSWHKAATSSRGIPASCSPTPATGLGVQRGTAVNPLISHLPRWVTAPPRTSGDILSLHKEGVGGEHRAVTHRHAVEDECAHPHRAAGANRGSIAFESAVLLRVALDLAPVIEDRLIPDGGESRLGDMRAVVEDPPADPNTHQPPEHVLERRAIESVQVVNRMHLPNPLSPPEIGMIDGANGRLRWVQRDDATLHPTQEDGGDHHAEREEHSVHPVWKHVVKLDGGQVEEGEQEDTQPPCDKKNADGMKVASILCREAAAQRLPRPEMVESRVALDRAGNLETWGAQEADSFTNLSVERNQHLGPEEDVVARPATRGIRHVVPHEVVRPNRYSRHVERGARNLVVHQMQPVRDHRPAADSAQRRVRVHHFGAEIHAGLHDWLEAISKPLQEVDDVIAITEQIREEPHSANPRNRPVRRIVEAVERIDDVRLDKRAQQARHGDHEQEASEREAEKEHQREDQRFDEEPNQGARTPRMKDLSQRGCPVDRQARTHLNKRQVQQQDDEQGGRGIDGPTPRAGLSRRDSHVVHVRALCRRSVPPLTVRHRLAAVQPGGVTELRSISDGRVDVEHRPFADEHIPAERYRSDLEPPGLRPVALEDRLLADHRPCADGQEIGTHRHAPGEDHDAWPDFRAQCSQIQHIQGRAEEQTGGGARPDERLHDPEAEVCETPQTDPLGFPTPNQYPLRHDRNGADNEESRAARQY